jgi:hypothetical protein
MIEKIKTKSYYLGKMCRFLKCVNENTPTCEKCEVEITHNENFDRWGSVSCKIHRPTGFEENTGDDDGREG